MEPVVVPTMEELPPEAAPGGALEPRAEATSLESLVEHRTEIDAHAPLEAAHRAFVDRDVEYMAVQRHGRVVGLCARGQIGFVMGSRFGFSLFSKHRVETQLVAEPLIVRFDTPVRELLARAMGRRGVKFHEEIVLVDAAGGLLGLIQVESLARLQSRLVAEQLEDMRVQQVRMTEQNLELYRANRALRESKGLYLGLFESHTLGVALVDRRGRIQAHNQRLRELLGLGETAATVISLTAWVVETERAGFLALLRALAERNSAPVTREYTLHSPGRGPRLFRVSTGWIAETGQICACLEDITDQRALERIMLQQEKQNLLDTLVGGIAHELNNKLTPVMGFAELVHARADAESKQHTYYIRKSVEEAATIIRQLLQLSKPMASTTQAIDLRSVVEETVSMLRFQIREISCQVAVNRPDVPVTILGDPAHLKQVLMNLVFNALQAMEEATAPTLTIATEVAGGNARLRIGDNGCGIAAEHVGRIFDPFFTTKGPERGSGLGLSICYSIVRQHGGQILVESALGKGTTFTLQFPLEGEGVPALSGSEHLAPRPALAPGPRSTKRVLVVDDEEGVQRLLQEMLRTGFGCEVDLADNGVEALLAIERAEYGLIVSDIRMPTMTGPELYRRLSQLRPDLAARFVFITGYPGRESQDEISQWSVPVIAKPFTLARIIEVCAPLLRNSG